MKRVTEHLHDYFFNPERAENYLNSVKKGSKARFIHFLSTLKKLQINGRYLDVGCGPGVLTQMVSRQHPNVKIAAIDNSKEMIGLAVNDLDRNLKDKIEYRVVDASDHDSITGLGKFDLIFSTFTMHHWNDPPSVIRDLYSMLTENGTLYIYDLKRVRWLYYIRSENGFFKSIRASYRPAEMREILENMGIRNFKVKTIFPYFMISVLIRK